MNRSEMKKFIQSLSVDEAARVLKDMLDNDAKLLKTVYETAIKIAGDVDTDTIMNKVFNSLDNLDMDDLSGRAGRTRYGYTEPSDAAWELFEEALDPFIYEMKKNHQRGLSVIAKIYCIGIIKGLWEYDRGSSSDLSDWLEDAPGEYIDTVVNEWKKGKPSSEDIAEVMSVARGDKQ
jgi:hypothetical protein